LKEISRLERKKDLLVTRQFQKLITCFVKKGLKNVREKLKNKKIKFIARTCTIKPWEAWHFALDLKVEATSKNHWV
jgi:hypothetical protein